MLSVAYAWALLSSGALAGVEVWLLSAERWLDVTADMRARPDAPAAKMVVVDQAAFRLLPGAIAVYRAGQALAQGNLLATVTYAQQALDLVPVDDVLLSLANQAHGDRPAALESLSRVLTLAERQGYVRTFVDEGPPMKLLIADCRLQIGESNRHVDTLLAYIDMLLAAFPGKRATKDQSEINNLQSAIVEPLSEREREVLRLLRTDLSGPEIARELIVSLSTVRTHTSNIYDKLGVTNRRAAIRRAAELDLF